MRSHRFAIGASHWDLRYDDSNLWIGDLEVRIAVVNAGLPSVEDGLPSVETGFAVVEVEFASVEAGLPSVNVLLAVSRRKCPGFGDAEQGERGQRGEQRLDGGRANLDETRGDLRGGERFSSALHGLADGLHLLGQALRLGLGARSRWAESIPAVSTPDNPSPSCC